MPQFRPYQAEAVKELLYAKKLLIADDMGLGKCAEALVGKNQIEKVLGYDSPTLILSPSGVVKHWIDEVKTWYKKGKHTKIQYIETGTFDSDVVKAKHADVALIGYSTLSKLGKNKEKITKLRELGAKYGIIDEAHNAKNPESIRGAGVKSIFDDMDYLAILSGTPIPGTVVDIYMLLSLLDKETFTFDPERPRSALSNFYRMFQEDPEFVRNLLGNHMIRRTAEDYLSEKFPELHQHELEFPLDGAHRDVYLDIYHNDSIAPNLKLLELRKAVLDPNLVKAEYLSDSLAKKSGTFESTTYQQLDQLVEQSMDEKRKMLAYTDFKVGVRDVLKERYDKFGSIVIDGNVTATTGSKEVSKREAARLQFQRDSNTNVLIATSVMDEGIDLTAAGTIAHLTLPYLPSIFDQRNRRPQRPGEVEKDYVDSYVFKPIIDQYIPTIAEGMINLLNDKRRIIEYLLKEPFSLTKDDLDEIKNGKAEKSKHLAPLIKSGPESMGTHFGQIKGQGHQKVNQFYSKYPEQAKIIAGLYANHWEGYYGGNTANLYKKVIDILSSNQNLERKLDIASGPFSLSRRLGEPVVNIDINPYMLQAGKMLEAEGTITGANQAYQASFHQLPLKDGSFDLVLCANALHLAKATKGLNERELVLREMNRVLDKEGIGLITIPHSQISEYHLGSFYSVVEQLGFSVLPFSGFYRGPKETKFRVYLAGLQKADEPSQVPVDYLSLAWLKKESGKSVRKATKKRKQAVAPSRTVEQEFVTEFFSGRKSLEELVD